MDMDLSADQAPFVRAAERLAEDFAAPPPKGVRAAFSADLQRRIEDAGFAGLSLTEGFGALEAALVVDAIARAPAVAELGASLLVAPGVFGRVVEGPIAIVDDWRRPARFLSVAHTAIVADGDGYVLMAVDPAGVVAASTPMAYPYGRFREAPAVGTRLDAGQLRSLALWRRVALAVEAAAAMGAAMAFTSAYVSERRQFGQPIGAFQAIQHRLARGKVHADAARLLALEAAAKGDALTATLAAVYVQRFMAEIVEDAHQFNGAMGITLDHALHYWTYRLVGLQSELGGLDGLARAGADLVWPVDAPPPPAPDAVSPIAYGQLGW